jgi:hypothetical protein
MIHITSMLGSPASARSRIFQRSRRASQSPKLRRRWSTDAERLGDILSGKAEVPLIETTVDGQLTTHATMIAVEEFRSLGLSDREIAAAVSGTKQSKTAIGDAEWLRNALLADDAWVQKWTAGNKVARGQLMLLDIIRNATPID